MKKRVIFCGLLVLVVSTVWAEDASVRVDVSIPCAMGITAAMQDLREHPTSVEIGAVGCIEREDQVEISLRRSNREGHARGGGRVYFFSADGKRMLKVEPRR